MKSTLHYKVNMIYLYTMNIKKALDQIYEIHSQLSKTEIFRGYTPLMVFLISIPAIILSFYQYFNMSWIDEMLFIVQWIVFAFIICIIVSINIVLQCQNPTNNINLLLYKKVLLQFLPGLLSGLVVSVIALFCIREIIIFLPGIWALLFGMSVFSMLPYLPKYVVISGIFYLLAGCILLFLTRYNLSLHPFGMCITFGFGHLISALILYLEKK